MKNPLARWSNLQLAWIVTWLISATSSVFLYLSDVINMFRFSEDLCKFTGIGEALLALIAPQNWFGILTVALTIFGLLRIINQVNERQPFIARYKWLALIVLVLAIALTFQLGC